MTAEPFSIRIPDAELADLGRRLDATRWPDEIDGADWELGANLTYMRALTEYWRNGYDWRREEAQLNQLPQFKMNIDGLGIHFVHARGKGHSSLPLIITHGWPGSFIEMTKLIPLLTDPEAHGGRAEDAFDVVVPSLPGYGFSDHPRERGVDPQAIAASWTQLMRELGYERFCAQGGDWGSAITLMLGLHHADHIHGLHLNYIAGRFLLGPALSYDPEDAAAKAYSEQLRAWADAEGGYSHQQGTKPQTLGYGLNDSPVGLAAWIIEKFQSWSDCNDHVENIFSRDELLTNVMIYWLTLTMPSAIRLYYESRQRPFVLSRENFVRPPVAVALFPKEIPAPPRELAERGMNIARWTQMPKGGHFAAMEQPALLAEDLREFFRAFR